MEHDLAHRSGSGVGHLRKSFFISLVCTTIQRVLLLLWFTPNDNSTDGRRLFVQLERAAAHDDAGFQLHKNGFLLSYSHPARHSANEWNDLAVVPGPD